MEWRHFTLTIVRVLLVQLLLAQFALVLVWGEPLLRRRLLVQELILPNLSPPRLYNR